jgi:tetratricopeptide (TPR) repeat protein
MKPLILLALAGITGALFFQAPIETGVETQAAEQAVRLSEHAMALFERGYFSQAKLAFTEVRVELTQLVGPRDPATLNSRNNFAAVLCALGDYAGAESAHRSALMLRERVLGRLHPDALASRQNLAFTLMGEGKYVEALENARRAECGFRKVFGLRDPKSREATRLKEVIESMMDGSKRGNDAPHGGPSGLGESFSGTA